MVVDVLLVLHVDGAVLEDVLVFFVIHWVAYANVLEKFSLEVFFVDAFNQVFSLQSEELLRLMVESILNDTQEGIVKFETLREVLLA